MPPSNTKPRCLVLSITAGIILSIPWYDFGTGVALFFGIIPLLYLVDSLSADQKRARIRIALYTGISAIINQKGETLDQLTWDIRRTVKGSVYLNDNQTFYTRYGNYIGDIFRIPALAFLLALAIHFIVSKVRKTAHN